MEERAIFHSVMEADSFQPCGNGTGNYYVEAQTRDARRTDVIVDYAGE